MHELHDRLRLIEPQRAKPVRLVRHDVVRRRRLSAVAFARREPAPTVGTENEPAVLLPIRQVRREAIDMMGRASAIASSRCAAITSSNRSCRRRQNCTSSMGGESTTSRPIAKPPTLRYTSARR